MITRLMLNPKQHILTPDQELNLNQLMEVLQDIEDSYDQDLVINRGFSTPTEQMAIYDGINASRKTKGLPPIKAPMGSAHCKAAAADISDPKGELYAWLEDNVVLREDLGIAMEDKTFTPTWVHVQIYLPASGKLIFIP